MSRGRQLWRTGWRLAVCGLLLAWIFQAIFWNEGFQAWQKSGQKPAWSELTRTQRLEISWTHGPRELWRQGRLIQPGALVLSLTCMGLTILLGTMRWRLALRVQGLELSFGRAAEISLVAHFFNSFLLGSTGGDLMKAYYAARETQHKKTEAVTTVFVDRLIGLFAMLLFAALMMLPNLPLLFSHQKLAAVAWFTLAMFAACSGIVALAFWGGLSRGLPQGRVWLRKLPKGDLLERSLDSCRQFGRAPGFLTQSLALSMLLNAVCVVQVLALVWGLGLAIPTVAMFVIVPTIICISALPITPSGLGVRENLYVLMLAAPEIAVSPASALSLSLLIYAGGLVWSLVGGAVYLGCRSRHHLSEAELAGQ